MPITIRKVETRKDRDVFIKLPFILHKNHKLWVPPLYIHERNFIDPIKNQHMLYSKTIYLLAYKYGIPVGRIMGIINNKLIKKWNDKQARFCKFESINDQNVAHKLLSTIEIWAKNNDIKRIVGPFGFSNQDPQGFIIEGFNERPSIGTIYNFKYIPQLVENEGYKKEADYVTYKVTIPEYVPDIYEEIAERVKMRMKLNLIEFTKKRELKSILLKILLFMNKTYKDIYGFIPLNQHSIQKSTRNYCEIVDPRLLKVVTTTNGKIVGFILGIKDITDGFKKARGRLIPFGYFIIKSTQKKSNRLDLLLGAIDEKYRGKGINTLLAIAMLKTARTLGLDYIDSHHELETNLKVQAEMKRLGGFIYKRHRAYQKDLN